MQGFEQLALAQRRVKLPLRSRRGVERIRAAVALAQALEPVFKGLRCGGAVRQLTRADACHPLRNSIGRALGQVHHALRHTQPSQATAVARTLVHGHQDGLGFLAQKFGVHQRTRGHQAHHFALHWPFARNLAHLLTNGD